LRKILNIFLYINASNIEPHMPNIKYIQSHIGFLVITCGNCSIINKGLLLITSIIAVTISKNTKCQISI